MPKLDASLQSGNAPMSTSPDDALTMGVEEEYQIIDPTTRQLTGRARQVIASAQRHAGDTDIQSEVYTSMVEIATPVCTTLNDLRSQIIDARRTVISAAAADGQAIAAAGTHPFSDWRHQIVTPKGRYYDLVNDYQQIMEDLVIFGFHIHIGIGDRNLAIQVLNRTRLWLPLLLALSVNSPFWMGNKTGYASYRTELWSRWPFAGPPASFESYEDYAHLTQTLTRLGVIRDATKIYWDIRLSDSLPTLEFRCADVCLSVDEAVMLAGLVRALARSCYYDSLAKTPTPVVRPEVLRAAHWRAARSGLDGILIDVAAQQAMPAADLVHRFLHNLRPVLEELNDWNCVSSLVEQTLQQGTGAVRQLQVYERTQQLDAVVDYIIAQTAAAIE